MDFNSQSTLCMRLYLESLTGVPVRAYQLHHPLANSWGPQISGGGCASKTCRFPSSSAFSLDISLRFDHFVPNSTTPSRPSPLVTCVKGLCLLISLNSATAQRAYKFSAVNPPWHHGSSTSETTLDPEVCSRPQRAQIAEKISRFL